MQVSTWMRCFMVYSCLQESEPRPAFHLIHVFLNLTDLHPTQAA